MRAAIKGKREAISVLPEWRSRLGEYGPILLLAVLGLIWSLTFWQHFVFPNSDYFTFVSTGRQWLSFQIPTSMKRAPVFSVIAGLISMIFSHPRAQLAATEMYNALLLSASMMLFYLVGRDLLGRPAAMVTAFLAGVSPWMVRMSSEPLAEMTLVVLFAAGVLCVARGRMGWAYVLAMLASIARWDMAALVPAVALADLGRNRRLRAMLWKAGLASVPFLLCMLITKMQLAGAQTGAHYLQVLSEERGFALGQDLRSYWEAMLASVAAPPSWNSGGRIHVFEQTKPVVFWLTAIPLGLAFLWGSVRGLAGRRWEILVILVTGVPYVLVHAVYPYRVGRYCVPMAWAGLIIAIYGAKNALEFLHEKWSAWRYVKPALQAGAAVLLTAWAVGVWYTLDFGMERKVCPGIGFAVGWSAAVAVAGYWGYEWVRAARVGLHWAAVPALLLLAVLSSGTQTAVLMGDGRMLINFQKLSVWFKENAQPGDKMMTNMPHYMPIYTGLPSERFVHTGSISLDTAPDFPGFVAACRKMGVTLIAWDSGLADNTGDRYYKLWGLDRVQPLGLPFAGKPVERIGSCKLVYTIREDWPKVAVWRITP